MFGMGSSVGVYVDGRHIYVAEINSHFGQSQLVRSIAADVVLSATHPTPDDEAVAGTLADIFRKQGIRGKEVFVAIPEKESMVRYFEMPLMPGRERAAAARYEAQKYLPFDIRDLYFDAAIQVDKVQKKMKTTVLAAKKEGVHRVVSTLRAAGLKVKSIEAAPMATARALYPADAKSGNDVFGIVDIDRRGFMNILIVKNELLVMARDHVYFKPAELGTSPEPDFKSCVSELRLSLNYFTKNFKNEQLSRILLHADLKNTFQQWDSRLESELGIPVRPADAQALAGANPPFSAGITVAAGLALRSGSGTRGMKLNLLPKERPAHAVQSAVPSQKMESDFLKKLLLLEVLLILAAASLLYSFYYSKLAAATAELSRQKQSIPEESKMSMDDLMIKEKQLGERAAFLSGLIGKRIYWTSKMNALAKTIPSNVHLSTLDYSDAESKTGESTLSLKIEGMLLSRLGGVDLTELNRLVAALAEDKEFMKGFDDIRVVSAQNVMINETLTTKFILSCSKRTAQP